MEISSQLEDLGIDKSLAKIYIVLLSNGPLSASALSGKLNIDRTSAYYMLKKLHGQGLVSIMRKTNTQMFKAADPKGLLSIYEEKLSNCRQLIPKLNKLYQDTESPGTAEVYLGYAGLRTLIRSLGPDIKEVFIFGEQGQFAELFPEYIYAYLNAIKDFNIKEKVLASENQRGKIKGTSKSRIRYLPNKCKCPATTVITQHSVIISVWRKQMVNVVITSPEISQSYISIFKELWKKAKP